MKTRTTTSKPPENLPAPIDGVVARFVDAVNADPIFKVMLDQFDAAERQKVAERDAEARRIEELKAEEQLLRGRLDHLQAEIIAASAAVPSAPAEGQCRHR